MYQIIESDHREGLERKVLEQIVEGWQPLGGVAIAQQLCDGTKFTGDQCSTLYDAGITYVQAMIKRDEYIP